MQIFWGLLCVSVFAIHSCEYLLPGVRVHFPETDHEALMDELAEAELVWAEYSYEDYLFIFSSDRDPFSRVRVAGTNRIMSVMSLQSEPLILRPVNESAARPINTLFQVLYFAIGSGYTPPNENDTDTTGSFEQFPLAKEVAVLFDVHFGYPRAMCILWRGGIDLHSYYPQNGPDNHLDDVLWLPSADASDAVYLANVYSVLPLNMTQRMQWELLENRSIWNANKPRESYTYENVLVSQNITTKVVVEKTPSVTGVEKASPPPMKTIDQWFKSIEQAIKIIDIYLVAWEQWYCDPYREDCEHEKTITPSPADFLTVSATPASLQGEVSISISPTPSPWNNFGIMADVSVPPSQALQASESTTVSPTPVPSALSPQNETPTNSVEPSSWLSPSSIYISPSHSLFPESTINNGPSSSLSPSSISISPSHSLFSQSTINNGPSSSLSPSSISISPSHSLSINNGQYAENVSISISPSRSPAPETSAASISHSHSTAPGTSAVSISPSRSPAPGTSVLFDASVSPSLHQIDGPTQPPESSTTEKPIELPRPPPATTKPPTTTTTEPLPQIPIYYYVRVEYDKLMGYPTRINISLAEQINATPPLEARMLFADVENRNLDDFTLPVSPSPEPSPEPEPIPRGIDFARLSAIILGTYKRLWVHLIAWTIVTVALVFMLSGFNQARFWPEPSSRKTVFIWFPLGSLFLGVVIGFVQGALSSALLAGLYSTMPIDVGVDMAAGLGIGQGIIICYFHAGKADFVHL